MLATMVTFDRRAVAGLATALGLVLLIAGCQKATNTADGAGNTTSAGQPSSTSASTPFAGTWTGTWTRTSPPPGSGTMTLVLQQSGQSISGTIDVGASACLTKGPVTGSVTGTAISLHTVTPAVNGTGNATGDYQATLSANKITGTLTVSCSVGVGVGTWEVTRQ
jgi:hypothetical protein